jgi:hypothetical protein
MRQRPSSFTTATTSLHRPRLHPQPDERAAHRSRPRSPHTLPGVSARRRRACCPLPIALSPAPAAVLSAPLRQRNRCAIRHASTRHSSSSLPRPSPARVAERARNHPLLAASSQQASASPLSPGECRRAHTVPVVEDSLRRATRDAHTTLAVQCAGQELGLEQAVPSIYFSWNASHAAPRPSPPLLGP